MQAVAAFALAWRGVLVHDQHIWILVPILEFWADQPCRQQA